MDHHDCVPSSPRAGQGTGGPAEGTGVVWLAKGCERWGEQGELGGSCSVTIEGTTSVHTPFTLPAVRQLCPSLHPVKCSGARYLFPGAAPWLELLHVLLLLTRPAGPL